MRHSIRVFSGVVAVTAVLAVGACSSSSKPTATQSTAPAKATGAPFVLGASVPETGTGNLKPFSDGMQAFVNYANADGGGFAGRPGNLKRCDYQNDPQKATSCARSLADDASVSVVSGAGRYADVLVSTFGAAADPVPYVCGGINRPAEGSASNSLCLYAGTPMGSYAALLYFKQQGFKKGYMATADSDAGHATIASTKGFAQSMGMTLDAGYFATSQADFLPVAQAAIGAKPDFILIGAGVSQELQLAQAFVTLGSSIPLGTWSSLLPQDSLNQLKSAKFSVAMDALTPDPSASQDPEMVLYRTWMKSSGGGAEIGDLSLQGWLVGRTMQAAAVKAGAGGGALNRPGILRALRTQELTVPLLPPLSLTKAPKQTAGYSSVANPTVHVALFQGGEKKILGLTATLP